MNDIVINIDTWRKERKLAYLPKHFVSTNTPLTAENKLWILERLHGRFYTSDAPDQFTDNDLFGYEDSYAWFEDPQEAILYELTWA
jgi:hypothetical protein